MFETDPAFGGGTGLAGAREFQFEPDLSKLAFVGGWDRHSNLGILPEETGLTHVDYSARVQTVDRDRHPLLAMLLQSFYEKTGCPVMINTSFNVRSEPIVCQPADALRCFTMTDMDVLVMGRQVLLKSEQPNPLSEAERQRHLAQFELD